MKRIFRHFAIINTLLFTPVIVFGTSGWTEYTSIVELIPTNHGRFLVRLDSPKNPSGCKNKDTFYQDYGTSGSEKMYLALLKAVEFNKKVRVFVTGKCGLNGYSEISSVSIVP